MAQVLVDTSAVFALVDRSDANHQAATATLRTLRTRRTTPFLTNFIVAECHALLLARISDDVARRVNLPGDLRARRVERCAYRSMASVRRTTARRTTMRAASGLGLPRTRLSCSKL